MNNLSDYASNVCDLINKTVFTDANGKKFNVSDGTKKCLTELDNVRKRNKNVVVVGNGGSAAIASHLQNDLVKACGIRSMVFTEQPLLTALTNDLGYETVYEIPIGVMADSGDLLIAISSSGQSKNILNAVKIALTKQMKIITLSGFNSGNPLRSLGHFNFYSSTSEYGLIENVHSIITHYLSDSLRKKV